VVSGRDLELALVGAVAVERVVELLVARRNARWSLARGGVEHGRGHYPWMVAVHVIVVVGTVIEPVLARRTFDGVRFALCAIAVAGAQAVRWWVIVTLGSRWNTRVIVVPGLPLVTGGPFRFMSHPNYLAVAVEVAALPAASGAWLTAGIGSALNALLMAVRIPCEETALGLRGTRA
jgi:methyltransferase